MPAADFSWSFPRCCQRDGQGKALTLQEISRGKMSGVPEATPDLPPCCSGRLSGIRSSSGSPAHGGLLSGFCSSSPHFVIGSLQIRDRSRHPGLDERFRSPRSAEDFHLFAPHHARRTRTLPFRAGLFNQEDSCSSATLRAAIHPRSSERGILGRFRNNQLMVFSQKEPVSCPSEDPAWSNVRN